MTLTPGQPAPDVEVYKADGAVVQLSSYWQTRLVVLSFLRHFGCQFCRELMTKLRAAYPDFVERRAAVITIAQGTPAQAAHFGNMFRIPFPILADPTRQAYRAYQVNEGTMNQFSPSLVSHMIDQAVHGNLPGVTDHVRALTGSNGSSLSQLGGTFIIDQRGIIRYVHIADPVYAVPTIAELLAVVDAQPFDEQTHAT
jgi:peroxiredoxin